MCRTTVYEIYCADCNRFMREHRGREYCEQVDEYYRKGYRSGLESSASWPDGYGSTDLASNKMCTHAITRTKCPGCARELKTETKETKCSDATANNKSWGKCKNGGSTTESSKYGDKHCSSCKCKKKST
ncbi:hypothetical protein B0H65DRAFT_433662 [Neurospora tetraspora]|uniref:Uncharacterized protein n=1 Tax=Neurospora tetraspora TaxID=94610 RepID=A0AAE0J982_9PEZI|nr:hypothetical protein B0H65DRAFT_433662 [Neurospora tetraspora]